MGRRDNLDAEFSHQRLHLVDIKVHVGEGRPEKGAFGEYRKHVLKIERDSLLGDKTAMTVPVIMAVGEPVAGKQRLAAGIERPKRRAQVADDRFDSDELAIAEVDRIADFHRKQPVGVLREGEVVIGDIAMHRDPRPALEDPAKTARMRRFLMGDEQVFERRPARFGQDILHLPFDFREILGMSGLDEHRGFRPADQKGGVVGMVELALVVLLQAVAEPEHAGGDFAGQRVRFG